MIAGTGGLLLFLLVPHGPYLARESKFNPRVIFDMFQSKAFRASALAYFGHMWELYTLWAFLPVFLSLYAEHHAVQVNVSFWSFNIIAAGTIIVVSMLGGSWSQIQWLMAALGVSIGFGF